MRYKLSRDGQPYSRNKAEDAKKPTNLQSYI